jgi:serine-type D-Ala-D-Ala carboxypeptidase/endopeptidase (penicillin-binding protein 4)
VNKHKNAGLLEKSGVIVKLTYVHLFKLKTSRIVITGSLLLAFSTPALAIPTATSEVPADAIQKFIKRSNSPELPSRSATSVRDSLTSQVLVYNRATEPHLPASVMKLVTAAVALQTYGPNHQLQTQAIWNEQTNSLFIVGAGDPMLTSSKIRMLARKAAGKISPNSRVKVFYDTSLFGDFKMPSGWPGFYVPRYVRPVSPLATFGSYSRTPAKEAAVTFTSALRENGVSALMKGPATATGVQVSRIPSPKMSILVRQMLEPSDNNSAETLHWLSAANSGTANWKTAAAHSRATMRQLGIDMTGWKIVDGSGLSRSNRLTTSGLTDLLLKALLPENPNLNSILADGLLPLGGKEGTLKTRFQQNRSKCAAQYVEAKTGTLYDTVALAGYARTIDGGLAAFAVLANDVPSRGRTNQVRARIDYMVTALTGCDATQPN